ncbi:hypothetical protein [Streptomyces acidiscabies]|uniref:hypothetical protein n=1 Tax=Streptomyces acidiscabies TaxID=42234 RepID=UPI000B1EEB12|nr:hypothetical protein [Streptomyces acidiscabies]
MVEETGLLGAAGLVVRGSPGFAEPACEFLVRRAVLLGGGVLGRVARRPRTL